VNKLFVSRRQVLRGAGGVTLALPILPSPTAWRVRGCVGGSAPTGHVHQRPRCGVDQLYAPGAVNAD